MHRLFLSVYWYVIFIVHSKQIIIKNVSKYCIYFAWNILGYDYCGDGSADREDENGECPPCPGDTVSFFNNIILEV